MRIVVNTGLSHIQSLTVSYGTGADQKAETLTPFSSDTDPSMNQFMYYYTVTAAIPYTFTATSNSGVTRTAVYTPTNIDNTIAAKEITAFSIGNAGVIDETNHKINVTVPYGTDVKNLVAAFTQTGSSIKVGGTAQVSGTTANDFTNPVIYTVTANDGSKQNYTVTVTVAALTNKVLVSITKPNDMTNILNGTAKTAEALKLPLAVTLVTDNGNVNASVNWDLGSSSYDAFKTTAQIFSVNGTVTLPAGVVNTNKVSLSTSINVTVNAASGGEPSKSVITGFLMDYNPTFNIRMMNI